MSPDERPVQLPYSATFVIRASKVLTWGEKAVWLELWALDKGPEGAWIGDKSLAEVLGLSEGTVKNYRFGLAKRGLAMTVPRPGARQVGWVMLLPAAASPGRTEKQVWGKRAVALGLLLDGYLRTKDGTAGGALTAMPGLPREQRPHGAQGNARIAGAGAAALGGRGENPTSEAVSEAQLPPVVEVGVGARAPEAEDGRKRAPTRAELLAVLRWIDRRASAGEITQEQRMLERRQVLGL